MFVRRLLNISADRQIIGKARSQSHPGSDQPRRHYYDYVSHPLGILIDMTQQLMLLDSSHFSWKLDERAKETGKRGLAMARAALDNTTRPQAA